MYYRERLSHQEEHQSQLKHISQKQTVLATHPAENCCFSWTAGGQVRVILMKGEVLGGIARMAEWILH